MCVNPVSALVCILLFVAVTVCLFVLLWVCVCVFVTFCVCVLCHPCFRVCVLCVCLFVFFSGYVFVCLRIFHVNMFVDVCALVCLTCVLVWV